MFTVQFYRLACALRLILFLGTVRSMSLELTHLKNDLEISDHVESAFESRLPKEIKSGRLGCLGCSDMKKNSKEYKMYLEYIKADILAKLGLKERPRKTVTATQIPAPVYEGTILEADEFGGSESKLNNQIIIIGEKASKEICPEQDCFFFRFKKKAFAKGGDVNSLQIWMYKLLGKDSHQSNKLKVSVARVNKEGQLMPEINGERNRLISMMHDGDSGWLGIDSAKAKDWVTQLDPRSNDIDLFLSLKCEGCVIARKGDKRPFIVINIENGSKLRKKRVIECHPRMRECCRESLYVNFTEIGWHDWIVQPSGYDANYCRGTCHGLSVPIYGYVTVIQQVKQGKKICCSPKSFTSLTILYRNENHLYKTNLPDMSVEKCGCS